MTIRTDLVLSRAALVLLVGERHVFASTAEMLDGCWRLEADGSWRLFLEDMHRCPRCKEVLEDGCEPDGCRDPRCPEVQ